MPTIARPPFLPSPALGRGFRVQLPAPSAPQAVAAVVPLRRRRIAEPLSFHAARALQGLGLADRPGWLAGYLDARAAYLAGRPSDDVREHLIAAGRAAHGGRDLGALADACLHFEAEGAPAPTGPRWVRVHEDLHLRFLDQAKATRRG